MLVYIAVYDSRKIQKIFKYAENKKTAEAPAKRRALPNPKKEP